MKQIRQKQAVHCPSIIMTCQRFDAGESVAHWSQLPFLEHASQSPSLPLSACPICLLTFRIISQAASRLFVLGNSLVHCLPIISWAEIDLKPFILNQITFLLFLCATSSTSIITSFLLIFNSRSLVNFSHSLISTLNTVLISR